MMITARTFDLNSWRKSVARALVVGSRLKLAEILLISSSSVGLSFEFIARPPKNADSFFTLFNNLTKLF